MSRRADTPRDLLFGLLALQTGLIDQSALVLAFHAWTRSADRPMAEILVEQSAIDLEQRPLLEALAAQHLRKHGGDAEKSLAAIGVGTSTRRKLAAIADPDLDDSLATVGAAAPSDDGSHDSSIRAIGTSTSGGQRFRVLRPHARGGLGEVFVALDAELNREVALKEILDSRDDPAHRSKFLVEAEITGGLEHPGIVPVYGLGHHEDGRPYYAMRFIQGDNLKQAIDHFHRDEGLRNDPGARSLALRKLLRRFVDVCNAIEYAHSRGVLHRDIKPGNVIVGKHGETLVIDWGLAKAKGLDDVAPGEGERNLVPASASGSVETLPGHAIGTPAYMSPEQAAGDLDRLGPRSDVYSLGATLYSLLTGRVPFRGDVLEVLQHVQEGDFPRPRAIDSRIDPALEALCLKAMARSPEDRYASPKALAEDLDRWSADEPLAAYAEPLARRARRWAKKNRTLVTAATAALLVAILGLASILAVQYQSNLTLTSTNDLLTAAIARETKANVGLKQANEEIRLTNRRLVEANERESKINSDLTLANERVQARFELARDSIQTFRATVTEDQVLKDLRFRPLRDKLLRSAAQFYGKLGGLLEGQPDRRSRRSLADAYFELADLFFEIDDRSASLSIFEKELSIRRDLARDRGPEDLLAVARCVARTGRLSGQTGRPAEAMAAYEESRRLIESTSWPPGLASEADSVLAMIENDVGFDLENTGEPAKALEAHHRALAIRERLVAANPSVAKFQSEVSESWNNIGFTLDRAGDPARALEAHIRALAIREGLAAANPTDESKADVAFSLNNVGFVQLHVGDSAKSLDFHRRSLAIWQALSAANPAVTRYQHETARGCNNVAFVLANTGEPAKALESNRRGLAILESLVAANPAVTEFQADLARNYNSIGFVLNRLDEPVKALESLERALTARDRLATENPSVVEYQVALKNTLIAVGMMADRLGRPGEAVPNLRRGLAMAGRMARKPADFFDLARWRSRLSGAALKPGSGLSPEAARAEADEAVAMFRKAIEEGYRDVRAALAHKDLDPIRSRPDFQDALMDLAFPDRPFAP